MCAECEPAISTTQWTVNVTTHCLIKGKCVASGTQDPTKCGTCDPTKSKYDWTPQPGKCQIKGVCYTSGTKHPQGCATCDPSKNLNLWTPNTAKDCLVDHQCRTTCGGACVDLQSDPSYCGTCTTKCAKGKVCLNGKCSSVSKIVLAALNSAYQGNLGGLTGAAALCDKDAALYKKGSGWKPFLSTSTKNIKDAFKGNQATSLPVVNLKGQKMFNNWKAIFVNNGYWSTSSGYLPTFSGKVVNEGQGTPKDWSDADGWTGTKTDGTVYTQHCTDWTKTTGYGMATELDSYRMLLQEPNHLCSQYLAVVCYRAE